MKQNHAVPVLLLALAATWVFAQQGEATPPAAKAAQEPKTPPAAAQDPKNLTKTPPPKAVAQGPTRPPAPTRKPAPAKKPWQEFKINPNTTMFLDFTESNPDAVISLFSRTSGITILKMPQFKSPLTVTSAKAVRLNEAFEIFNTVLGLSNYELRKQGNLLLVAMKQPPQGAPMQAPPPPPQPVVKTYPIVNASAAQVAKVVVDVYGPPAGGGGQPQGQPGAMRFVNGEMVPMGGGGGGAPGGGTGNFKVTSDEYSNSVIVKAMPDEQTKIEALIKDLDKSTALPLISEVFVLKYVPAEQAVSAIEDMLTANVPLGRGARRPDGGGGGGGNFFSFGFNPFGPPQRTAGNQSATAIKQTNSVNVNATKENMEMIRNLLKNLDQPAVFADNTTVIKLMNAKASDVADLLTKVFAQQRNNNENSFFFFDSFGGDSSRNKQQTTDFGDNGEIVNTRDISGKVKIEADNNTNSIVVVTQPSNMRMIQKVIDKLDVAAEQVVIETVIVEANLDKTTKLGVEYNFIGNLFGGSGIGGQNFGLQTDAANPVRGLQYTLSGDDYRIFLNAVQSDTRFKVLDTPRIFTSNNVKAEINVSQKVPYASGQSTTAIGPVITNTNFLDVGVVLTVTPRITANGQVTMEVVQSADDLQSFQTFGTLSAPITNQRKATTTVSVKDGETIVLGGIIQHTERQNNQKIPLLGDIPILGNLFRSSSKSQGQTELMVFLTPHIVRTNSDAQRLRKASTDDLTRPSQDSLKKIIPPVKMP